MISSMVGPDGLEGRLLTGLCVSVCAAGFLLFGYDQGVMSGVVISDYWIAAMGNPSTIIKSTLVAVFDVGALVGSIACAFMTDKLGRKRTLILGAIIVIIGAILMGTSYSRAQFFVARIITGIGIGFITSIAPVYVSEMLTAKWRGTLFCAQPTTLLFGLVITYFINYGCYFRPGEFQWRFPLVFQCIFAIYIAIVTTFLPETPRWLIQHDGNEMRGLLVLSKLRRSSGTDESVLKEKNEIVEAIRLETNEGAGWMDLFRDNGVAADKRFYLALAIQFMEQMSGINIVSYYAPTIFQESLGMDQKQSLFLGCWLQLFYFFASFLTWYMIDRLGRRFLFLSCAIAMCIVLVLEGVCVKLGGHSASVTAVVFVFCYEALFTWGWMATVWIYPPEILPLKLRAKGSSLAAASDFAGNFLVVEITPPALQNIGFKTYIIFAVFNIVNAMIVWCFFPETAGLTLETVDQLFVKDSSVEEELLESRSRMSGWKKWAQWDVVGKADVLRRRGLRHRAGAMDLTETKGDIALENVEVREGTAAA